MPYTLNLYVPDADAAWAQALAAGCQVRVPISDQFWGDRYGIVLDPFGISWAIATHQEDLTPEEIRQRAPQAFAGGQPQAAAIRDNRRMATLGLIEYADAGPEVKAVYDDIMTTRRTNWINNFWKALAQDPPTLRRTWQSVKEIMAPGALDALTKEMIYVAVSATNQCAYCIASHTASARKAGMTDQMFAEVMAVVGMANETNRLASGYQVEIDERFRVG